MNKENRNEDTFYTFADQLVSKERPADFDTIPFRCPSSDQMLICDAVACIMIYREERLTRLIRNALGANRNVDNRITYLLEKYNKYDL